MTEDQLKNFRKQQNQQIMMNQMRLDEESARIIREIVRSCHVGMDDWQKCQHLLLVRKFFLHALTKVADRPDHVLWYWEDDNGYYWYLLKCAIDRTKDPFRAAGLIEDSEKRFPHDVVKVYQGSMPCGGGSIGRLDFLTASVRAVEEDSLKAWRSAEDIWRKFYPLNASEPLPPIEIRKNQKTEVSDVLYNRCSDELVKWATKHRTAIRDQARARGFGNSGCLEGALQDFAEHCTWLRSIVRNAVDSLNAGEISKANELIDTLRCGPMACPMSKESHNGDCLELAKSKIKGLLLASSRTISIPFAVSPPSTNPERELLLASEMFARGILVAAEARDEGVPIPENFEKAWSDVCGGIACASREGWTAFAVAVDREVGDVVRNGAHEHPYGVLISRLKSAIRTSERIVRLVQGLQLDTSTSNLDAAHSQKENVGIPEQKREKTKPFKWSDFWRWGNNPEAPFGEVVKTLQELHVPRSSANSYAKKSRVTDKVVSRKKIQEALTKAKLLK